MYSGTADGNSCIGYRVFEENTCTKIRRPHGITFTRCLISFTARTGFPVNVVDEYRSSWTGAPAFPAFPGYRVLCVYNAKISKSPATRKLQPHWRGRTRRRYRLKPKINSLYSTKAHGPPALERLVSTPNTCYSTHFRSRGGRCVLWKRLYFPGYSDVRRNPITSVVARTKFTGDSYWFVRDEPEEKKGTLCIKIAFRDNVAAGHGETVLAFRSYCVASPRAHKLHGKYVISRRTLCNNLQNRVRCYVWDIAKIQHKVGQTRLLILRITNRVAVLLLRIRGVDLKLFNKN